MWENWCQFNGVAPVPVSPAIVVEFINDCSELGVDAIAAALKQVSASHVSRQLADPTAGGIVASAMNQLAKIDPPRSWTQDRKVMFSALPYDLQSYIAEREKQRDKAVRNAQNEAAAAKQALAEFKKENCHGLA